MAVAIHPPGDGLPKERNAQRRRNYSSLDDQCVIEKAIRAKKG
jgi:hypothetical protein